MDFMVRLFRALANANRLDILRYIALHPGTIVTKIAAELGLPQPVASKYLKVLSEHGIIEKRPAGTYVLAKLGNPANTRHELLREIRRTLAKVFASDEAANAAETACPEREEPTWTAVYEALCFDFTAYTHLRRLLILRFLDRKGSADLQEICRGIGMSHMAGWRHTDKLIRRGILFETKSGRKRVITIRKKPATWLRAQLLKCILSSIREESK